jgi:hypothetical protein
MENGIMNSRKKTKKDLSQKSAEKFVKNILRSYVNGKEKYNG